MWDGVGWEWKVLGSEEGQAGLSDKGWLAWLAGLAAPGWLGWPV